MYKISHGRLIGWVLLPIILWALILFTAFKVFSEDWTFLWEWDIGSGEPADGFRIYRGIQQGGPYGLWAEVPDPNSRKHTIQGVALDRNYYMVMTAYNAQAESGWSTEVSALYEPIIDTMPPDPPVLITVSAKKANPFVLIVTSILDTYININEDVNILSPILNTYTWPSMKIANAILMQFDLTGIPSDANIYEATLGLHLVEADASSDSTYIITVHKIINVNPDLTQATGFMYNGVNGWTPNACCFSNIPMAQADISLPYDTQAVTKILERKQWDLTQMVQEWVAAPSSNSGLLLNSDPLKGADRYRYFASSEYADPMFRPFLIIKYGYK